MLTINIFKINSSYYIRSGLVFILLLFDLLGSIDSVEVTINVDQSYFLNTGDVAKFECEQNKTIHPLKYGGDGSASVDDKVSITIKKTESTSASWECTREYGESAEYASKKEISGNKEYAIVFDVFGCAAADGKAKVLCEILESAANSIQLNKFLYALLILPFLSLLA